MWKQRLKELVSSGRYGTQSALVQALAEGGLAVTQSSVSRELKALSVRKVDGRYVLPPPGLPASVPLLEARTALSAPLVVLKTVAPGAGLLAEVIDQAEIPGVLGTIAGDNTVFAACADGDAVRALEAFLGHPLRVS